MPVKRWNICLLCGLTVLLCGLMLLRARPTASAKTPAAAAEETPSALASETETPAETPERDALETLLAGMTKEEKVWQMLILRPEQVCGEYSTADAAVWHTGMAARPVGGLVFDGSNILGEQELKEMLATAQTAGGTAVQPFLCVDEEGGAVARLAYQLGVTTDFKPMFTYREGGTQTAYANAATIAGDIRSFGFNVDFAPVADVWTNPANTVIGKRAYSDDPAEAAELVAAAVQGFHDGAGGGVMAVLKHFPGHGDTAEDSHDRPAYSDKTLAELRECEFLPFAAGIAAGADMVMMGHITLNRVDPDVPASLSYPAVTTLLREELGFRDGVVVTDAMEMSALASLTAGDAAVMAVEAGCDLILAPSDPETVFSAILERVPEARLDESLRRILTLKQEWGLLTLK